MRDTENRISNLVESIMAADRLYINTHASLQDKIITEKEKFELLVDALNRDPMNIQIARQLCIFLQIIDDKDLLTQFSLADIDRLFQASIMVDPNNIEFRMEYIYFLYNVLDKEDEALLEYHNLKRSTLDLFDKFESYINSL